MSCVRADIVGVAAAGLVACGPISGVPLGLDVMPATTESSGSTADTWLDGGTGEGDCSLPTLDDLTIGQVYIDAGPFPDVARGTGRQMRVATMSAGVTTAVDACVVWSIEPQTGATISTSGYVSVPADTAVGSNYVVTADIEDGRRVIDLDVMIYEPITTPILGFWYETLRLPCDDSLPFVPTNAVGELVFLDNSDFRVTWTPFESYVDYWGTFVHDPATGALTLSIAGGNATPSDFDGVGFATLLDGELHLDSMFLGSAPGRTPDPGCGHIFD